MEPTKQLSHILPLLTDLTEGIEPDQLDHPTPCAEFTVHGVLDHAATLGGSLAYLFRGEEPPAMEPLPRGDEVPVAEVRKAMEDLLDAVRSPGAMERTIASPAGTMPGETFARFLAFDALVHGWDLARSTGQAYDPPARVVEAADEFARQAITPEMRDGGLFAAPIDAPWDTSRLERLVAFSGRAI